MVINRGVGERLQDNDTVYLPSRLNNVMRSSESSESAPPL
jgi:hypothetical protein